MIQGTGFMIEQSQSLNSKFKHQMFKTLNSAIRIPKSKMWWPVTCNLLLITPLLHHSSFSIRHPQSKLRRLHYSCFFIRHSSLDCSSFVILFFFFIPHSMFDVHFLSAILCFSPYPRSTLFPPGILGVLTWLPSQLMMVQRLKWRR